MQLMINGGLITLDSTSLTDDLKTEVEQQLRQASPGSIHSDLEKKAKVLAKQRLKELLSQKSLYRERAQSDEKFLEFWFLLMEDVYLKALGELLIHDLEKNTPAS